MDLIGACLEQNRGLRQSGVLQDAKESSKQSLDMNGADFQAFCIEVGWVSGSLFRVSI